MKILNIEVSIPAFSSWNVLEFKFHQIPEKSDLAQNLSQKLEIAYILLCIAELDWPSIENFLIPFDNEYINSWNVPWNADFHVSYCKVD